MRENQTLAFDTDLPMVVKYVQPCANGIHSQILSRYSIGYVLHGTKYLYYGDKRFKIEGGDVFCLEPGIHYIEEVPEGNKPFEQIVLFYSSELLADIISELGLRYNLQIGCVKRHEPDEKVIRHNSGKAWRSLKSYFGGLNQYIRDGLLECDKGVEQMKMNELIYLLLSNPDCNIQHRVIGGIDMNSESFEQIIHKHILDNITIDELAKLCNRSTTAFKKEFGRRFGFPPHKWLINQRLMHSRLLLISTNYSVSCIGDMCNFPNTSHFIKLFKKEFGATPSVYRSRMAKSYDATRKERQAVACVPPKSSTTVIRPDSYRTSPQKAH